jgi:hypothetical protein
MRIYLFRDESKADVFAFSSDVTGENIPLITPHTEWIFLEAIDTLKFPAPWDITDFQEVLDRLKADGYYLFEGEFIEQPPKNKGHPTLAGVLGSPGMTSKVVESLNL